MSVQSNATRYTNIHDVNNFSSKPTNLPATIDLRAGNFIDAMAALINFTNARALAIQANAVTGSPFVVNTTGRKTLVIIAVVDEVFAAAGSDTVSLDVDGTLIGATKYSAGIAETQDGIIIGAIQNLAAGAHNVNVKMANAAASILQNLLAFEI